MKITAYDNSNLIPLHKHLLRPKMQNGESIYGFVYRFYDANQIKIPLATRALIKNFYLNQLSDEDLANQLQQVTGPVDVAMEYQWLQEQQFLKLKIYKYTTALTLANLRFCPMCLNENAVHWALWNLPMFTACPKHQCELARYCDRCHKSFTWKSLHTDWSCKCNAVIKDIKTPSATALQLKLCQLILNASDNPQSPYNNEKLTDGNQASYKLKELYEALTWVYFFRQKVKLVKYRQLYYSHLKTLKTINLSRFGHRESKFLFGINPEKKLVRILPKLAIRAYSLSTLLMKFRLLKVVSAECLFLVKNKNIFTDPFIPLFQSFISHCSIQLQNELTAWAMSTNPNAYMPRQVSLNQFVEWWIFVTDQRKLSDKELNIKKIRRNTFGGYFKLSVEKILKKLILASQWLGSAEIYQKLLVGFNFPTSVRGPCTLEDSLIEILNYLSSLETRTLSELTRRLDLAELIWKDAQIARDS
jgi:TniQ